MEKHGLKRSMLTIPDALLLPVIRGYTAEAGVRELERVIAAICRKAACEIAEGKQRVRLSRARLTEYLGQPKRREKAGDRPNMVGIANGLAWTSVGGEMLEIEVAVLPGTGQLQLTGRLGDVMQESARAALTFIKAHGGELGIEDGIFKASDIHIHVPEGAVPKDGPSAGITLATAIASALAHIPVRANVAMTGEISLRGSVLPIGGLREKLLAALRSGITVAVIPEENRKDLEEVPQQVREGLRIVPVKGAMEALRIALVDFPAKREYQSLVKPQSEAALSGTLVM